MSQNRFNITCLNSKFWAANKPVFFGFYSVSKSLFDNISTTREHQKQRVARGTRAFPFVPIIYFKVYVDLCLKPVDDIDSMHRLPAT